MKENNNDDATEVDIGPPLKAYPEHQWLCVGGGGGRCLNVMLDLLFSTH